MIETFILLSALGGENIDARQWLDSFHDEDSTAEKFMPTQMINTRVNRDEFFTDITCPIRIVQAQFIGP
jgi:hypothetical protein